MQLQDLTPEKGARKKRKRVGRGPGSGMGKTSGRGHKGLKARSGGSVRPGFEGGQMPLYRRLPKRGFNNIFKTDNAILNVQDLDRFEDGAIIDMAALREVGLVKGNVDGAKLLGNGETTKKFSLKNIQVSKIAQEKIESAGGSIEIQNRTVWHRAKKQ
ncbi:MAG: 50S ribosomal protein L15 [Pseudomonadota bacterium]